MQEDHGGGQRLIRIRYRQQLGGLAKAIALVGVVAAVVSLNIGVVPSVACAAATAIWLVAVRHGGRRLLQKTAAIVDELALEMGLIRCEVQPTQSLERHEQSGAPRVEAQAP